MESSAGNQSEILSSEKHPLVTDAALPRPGNHGDAGRPESVTMTCPLLRSRSAVTVVVQGWPVRGCTTIFAPTSWAGSEEVWPCQIAPQELSLRWWGRHPGSGACKTGDGDGGTCEGSMSGPSSRSSSRDSRERNQALTLRWRSVRRRSRRCRSSGSARNWMRALRIVML